MTEQPPEPEAPAADPGDEDPDAMAAEEVADPLGLAVPVPTLLPNPEPEPAPVEAEPTDPPPEEV